MADGGAGALAPPADGEQRTVRRQLGPNAEYQWVEVDGVRKVANSETGEVFVQTAEALVYGRVQTIQSNITLLYKQAEKLGLHFGMTFFFYLEKMHDVVTTPGVYDNPDVVTVQDAYIKVFHGVSEARREAQVRLFTPTCDERHISRMCMC
jgi:hypothetical protein